MAVGRSRRAVTLGALWLAVLALTPGAASAACPKHAQCSTLAVPLGHSGRSAGTLPLAYAKVRAPGAHTGTIVFLSGGPGQAAMPLIRPVAALLRPLRSNYDIVA